MKEILIICVVALVTGSAFFSSAEIAYNSASRHRIKSKAATGDKRAVLAQEINDNYTQMLSTVLVGNNLVNIATTSIITLLAVEIFADNGQLYAEILTTVILLIFGEIIPKILGAEYCNQLVLLYGAPIQFFESLFKPVVWIVTKFVDGISFLWTPEEQAPSMTNQELMLVVDSIEDEGVITEAEGEIIRQAIEFPDIKAHEILIPRVDVVAFDADADIKEFFETEGITHYTRIPIYEEDLDHIIGIINVKQLLKMVFQEQQWDKIDVRAIMVTPKFIHMTKSISDILKEMAEEKQKMAVVLDEFGGTMGILTAEDILEELVGDIFDETDKLDNDFTVVSEHEFCLSGNMNIYDAFEMIEYEPKDFDSEYTTLSGWITEMLDDFPKQGDTFQYDILTVTVLSVENKRVESAKIVVQNDLADKDIVAE